MKPLPLPPNPKLIDRVEYALQWLVAWAIIDIPDHPLLSGLCTGSILGSIGVIIIFCTSYLLAQHR